MSPIDGGPAPEAMMLLHPWGHQTQFVAATIVLVQTNIKTRDRLFDTMSAACLYLRGRLASGMYFPRECSTLFTARVL